MSNGTTRLENTVICSIEITPNSLGTEHYCKDTWIKSVTLKICFILGFVCFLYGRIRSTWLSTVVAEEPTVVSHYFLSANFHPESIQCGSLPPLDPEKTWTEIKATNIWFFKKKKWRLPKKTIFTQLGLTGGLTGLFNGQTKNERETPEPIRTNICSDYYKLFLINPKWFNIVS